jgi:hypothetical protein
MKYLAILSYDCGCKVEPGPGFLKTIKFYAREEVLNKRLEDFRKRLPKKGEGSQCIPDSPVEVLIIDEEFKKVKSWRRR